MEPVKTILLVLHVAGGFTALLAGLIPMIAKKGSRTHRLGGRAYLWSMTLAIVSSLPLAILRQSIFLGAIGLFTGYVIYTAYRSSARKSVVPASLPDKIMLGAALLVGLAMEGFALYAIFLLGNTEMGIVLGVFGLFLFLLAWKDLDYWRRPDSPAPKGWLLYHLGRFGGSYIATLTAFLVTNVRFLPEILVWLAPTLIGSMILSRVSRYWKHKLRLPVAGA